MHFAPTLSFSYRDNCFWKHYDLKSNFYKVKSRFWNECHSAAVFSSCSCQPGTFTHQAVNLILNRSLKALKSRLGTLLHFITITCKQLFSGGRRCPDTCHSLNMQNIFKLPFLDCGSSADITTNHWDISYRLNWESGIHYIIVSLIWVGLHADKCVVVCGNCYTVRLVTKTSYCRKRHHWVKHLSFWGLYY